MSRHQKFHRLSSAQRKKRRSRMRAQTPKRKTGRGMTDGANK